jgi:tetratricopeptide (TPR) repeat protein
MKTGKIMLAVALALVVATAGTAAAQEVIRKTTDESGFEKQLTEVDMMHQTANQLMSAGQFEEAAAELEKVVAMAPDRLEAWQDLAKCYVQLKNFEKAAAAYQTAHELQPDNLDLLSNLGYSQLNAGDLDGALATYNKMLEMDELSYDANVHLGFVFQKQGELEKAAAHYEKALEGRPDDVATMGSLGRVYTELGRIDDALAIYEKAVAIAPDDQKKQLLNKLGKGMIEKQDWAKAADAYAQLVALEPDSPANQFNLGISMMQSDRPKEAIPAFEATLDLAPEYAQAYQYLAQCYNDVGRYEEAISMVKVGLSKADANKKAGLYCAWGQSLEKMTLYDQAIEKFELAVNDPQYGGYAKQQIQRQRDLKKREKAMKGQ